MTRRVPWAREALALLGVDAEDILAPAEKLGPRPDCGVLCHGDLHIRQLLVGDALNGIIDWVDVCRADPGIDLSLLWSFVPRDMFGTFLSEYGPVGGGVAGRSASPGPGPQRDAGQVRARCR